MHIMIDLETMGTRPNAPIVAIGAVAFDASGVKEEFYRAIALQSAVAGGGVIDASTVLWWMQQSDEARSALTSDNAEPLEPSLRDMGQMICGYGNGLKGVWGNGASFDNVIVHEACGRLGMAGLWEFWKDRCYRTVKGMYPGVKLVRSGTHHNALHDARTQALHLIAINTAAGGIVL